MESHNILEGDFKFTVDAILRRKLKNEELLKELNRFGLNFRSVPEVMEYLQNNQNKIDIEVDQILKKHTEKLMKIYYGKKGMETFLF